MKIERINISDLSCDPANVRKHSDTNMDAIKNSLRRFGQQKPIVIDEKNIIIAGNGTFEASKLLDWDTIDCVRTDLDSFNKTAFAIADNRTGELAEWHDEDLARILKELNEQDEFILDDLSFSVDDLPDDTFSDGNTDDDEIPEVDQNIHNVKLGDIWSLGSHRLVCGDSTDAGQVAILMDGEKADMVFTDPPYGINLDTNYSSMTSKKSSFKRNVSDKKIIANDDKTFSAKFIIENFDCELFLWGANYYAHSIPENEGSWIVWDKRQTESLDKMYGSCFELCWSKIPHKQDIARVTWAGCFGHSKKDDGAKKVHPTMKPVKLAEWFFDKWGKDKNLIVDLFLGSGSTLVACEKTNRKCYGMELDPHYCSVIIERWQNFTGEKASLLTGGNNGD